MCLGMGTSDRSISGTRYQWAAISSFEHRHLIDARIQPIAYCERSPPTRSASDRHQSTPWPEHVVRRETREMTRFSGVFNSAIYESHMFHHRSAFLRLAAISRLVFQRNICGKFFTVREATLEAFSDARTSFFIHRITVFRCWFVDTICVLRWSTDGSWLATRSVMAVVDWGRWERFGCDTERWKWMNIYSLPFYCAEIFFDADYFSHACNDCNELFYVLSLPFSHAMQWLLNKNRCIFAFQSFDIL